MAKILCLESSTEVCSVAIFEDDKLVDFREDRGGQNHSKLLTLFIQQLMQENNLSASGFSAVAVSEGPGSYTGLRIGVSAAKGFCYAAGIPLLAVSPLEAMTAGVIKNASSLGLSVGMSDLFIPMIDARRMEVYSAIYDAKLDRVREVCAEIITTDSFSDFSDNSGLFVFGNGSVKCKSVLNRPDIHFIDNIYASSLNMGDIAFRKFANGEFIDVAYFEPFYLKDFIATVPKNSVLGNEGMRE